MHKKRATLYRVSRYDKAGSRLDDASKQTTDRWKGRACVSLRGLQRVESGRRGWNGDRPTGEGSHNSETNIPHRLCTRDRNPSRQAGLLLSNGKECFSARRYVANTRSVVIFNVTRVLNIDETRVSKRENPMDLRRIIESGAKWWMRGESDRAK